MSNHDAPVFLQPGQEGLPVRAGGDFIFVKSADRPIRVRVNEQSVLMRAGDKRRFNRSPDNPREPAFTSFEVDNPDATAPLTCIFVVGLGDYNAQIITGEVTITPGIQAAGGQFITDTREVIELQVAAPVRDQVVETFGGLNFNSDLAPVGGNVSAAAIAGDYVFTADGQNGTGAEIVGFDRRTGRVAINRGTNSAVAFVQDMAYNPRDGLMYVIDAERRVFRFNPFAALPGQNFSAAIEQLGRGCCFDAAGFFYVLHQGNILRRYSVPSFTLLDTWDLTALGGESLILQMYGIDYDARADRFMIASYNSSNMSRFAIDNDGNLQNYTRFSGPENALTLSIDPDRGEYWHGVSSNVIKNRQYYDRTVTAQLFANADAFKNALAAEARPITANIGFADTFSSNFVVMTGESIKAILQAYLSSESQLGDNYLDSVYRLEYFDGSRQRIVGSGGESFALAGIADNFTIALPGTVKLTLRAGIT